MVHKSLDLCAWLNVDLCSTKKVYFICPSFNDVVTNIYRLNRTMNACQIHEDENGKTECGAAEGHKSN